MKEKLENQKGITLVALVITIIIMLILAIVSVNIIVNQGIIKKSEDAVDKYKEKEGEEQANLIEIEKIIGKYDRWWELTEEEKTEIESGSEGIGNIAVKGNGSTAGSIFVALSKNENWVGIQYLTNTEIDIYFYYFGEGEGTINFLDGVKLEKNKTWYFLTYDGSNVLTKEEYKGSSPIKKEDFAEGEIISESYLQRVINSF